jgi:pimeloyl-ACP methyl ester carboxylesterase
MSSGFSCRALRRNCSGWWPTCYPRRYFLDALDTPDAVTLGVPIAYIASKSDHAVQWPVAEFAARLAVEPIVVPGTHDSMLTHPDEVAEAILAA